MGETSIGVVAQEVISAGMLLGPLPCCTGSVDPLVLLAWRCQEDASYSRQLIRVNAHDSNTSFISWLIHVQPARDPEEQNLEVMVSGGQLFFRSMRIIHADEELLAWFGKELAEVLQLPTVPPSVTDSVKRYQCILCKESFQFPHPVISHLMYRCEKRAFLVSSPSPVASLDTKPAESMLPVKKARVRKFDIASLTNANSDDSSSTSPMVVEIDNIAESNSNLKKVHKSTENRPVKRMRSAESDKSNAESEEAQLQRGKSQLKNQVSTDISHCRSKEMTPVRQEVNENVSAFKKVDKVSNFVSSITATSQTCSGFPTTLITKTSPLYAPTTQSLASFPFPINTVASPRSTLQQGLLAVPMGMCRESDIPGGIFSLTHKLGSKNDTMDAENLRGDSGRPESRLLPATHLNAYRRPASVSFPYGKPFPSPLDNFTTKPFPPPLLTFLPPSLAALSFPTQNWCAKCNATFRMTSDLVYHMRSHHKRDIDPVKKKREEKLKCNICNESFRERHHLTRHMTSHQ